MTDHRCGDSLLRRRGASHFQQASVELHFMAYNWCRPHGSLRSETTNKVTPAMAAGIARRPWTIEDVVGLLDPRI